ncbi:MAG: hypothetical protein EOM37_14665 [Proteobacteria bacterium]|nr:hypothetical protein [Pseudomonadota bacterium]
MDYIANVENSEIDVSGIRTVLVQGDSSYPVIRFVLDPSLTGFKWNVRGTYIDSNIAVISSLLVPVETETSVTLDWSVSSDFTTYDGDMQLVLVGANDLGTTVVKALAEITIQKDWSIGTMQTVTLNLFEQLMAQANTAISKYPTVTNGNWYVWNVTAEEYQDTGVAASSQWKSGTGITGTSTTPTAFPSSGITMSNVGDMYLNASTNNTYRCTVSGAAAVALWVYVSNITGPQPDDATSTNLLIDGGFQIWAAGDSFTNPAHGSYTATMWKVGVAYADGGTFPSSIVHAQIKSPTEYSESAYRIVVNGAGSGYGANAAYGIRQHIEHGTRMYAGAGKKVTVSFRARTGLAGKRIGIAIHQDYGTGGSPSAGEWTNGANFTLTSDFQTFTHTFELKTLAGKTFGTAFDDSLWVDLWAVWGTTTAAYVGASTAETFGGSSAIEIIDFQVNPGGVALPYVPAKYSDTAALTQRYFTVGGSRCAGYAAATYAYIRIPLSTQLRTTPTVTLVSGDNLVVGTGTVAISSVDTPDISNSGLQVRFTIGTSITGVQPACTGSTVFTIDARM